MKRKLTIVFFLAIIIFFFSHQQYNYTKKEITFTDKGNLLKGTLNIPKKKKENSTPLVIFVHGDGETPADNFGYYQYIWDVLAENGIASMSWSKKGVGRSEGNWLQQSMDDRAEEVVSAINTIKNNKEHKFSTIGIIGFSQAGWVLPKITSICNDIDFIISVSGAINWKRQSNYLVKKKLEIIGKNTNEITKSVQENRREFEVFNTNKNYNDFIKYQNNRKTNVEEIISSDRFYFIQKNINSDATEDLKKVKCPIFGIFGNADLNVDFQESYDTYKAIFSKTIPTKYKLKIYSNATHGLLKSDTFNTLNPNLFFLLKLKIYGKSAFAKGVLEDITQFILENTNREK